MTSFDVVFQFLCPNCGYIGSGQEVFQANTADEASRMLTTIVLPCAVCHQSVKHDVTAKTYVFESAQLPAPTIGLTVP